MKIEELCIEISVGLNGDMPWHYSYCSSIEEAIEDLKRLKEEIPTWEEDDEI